ncbi:sensor histidine kinase [Actinomadura flavalba]|uniref:sensor histidine kinase n=1 Tax=Actinomadura flavalba TaxID=1120938 RepID=UPI00037B4AAD|nr:sensor histidine kinase [Actinomadura flavalba]
MATGLWEWWRGRRTLVDAAFAAPILLLGLLQTPFVADGSLARAPSLPVYLAFTVALTVPLAWRRRWPRAVFAVLALVGFTQWCAGFLSFPADLSLLVALYTVTAYSSPNWGVASVLTAQFGAVLLAVRMTRVDWSHFAQGLLTVSAVVFGVWILGVYMRTRREYLRSVEDRAARLERERDAEVSMARSAERARIARELHDVVAHNVSVIVVQADGAAYALDTDPGRARQALGAISDTGRLALTEMRRLLGVLREDDASAGTRPQPGLGQLGELVGSVREAGLPVELEVGGDPPAMSQGRQLTVYRVVQEALTNTLKHAGPSAAARVRLRYAADAVEILVSDDGRGAAANDDGRGHGLPGMRERVAVYGGEVRAAPRSGGGFEVAARIPVREESAP